jgi:hypothetical protein
VLQSGSVAAKEMKLSFSRDGKYLGIDQLRLRIESPSPEAFDIGLKLPLSYYLSSSNLSSIASGEVILFSPLNDGTMEIPGVYVARQEDAPIPPSIMKEWTNHQNGLSQLLLHALTPTYWEIRYRENSWVSFELHMAAKTRAQSGTLKLKPTILVYCENPSSKKIIEKAISRQKFRGSFQVIVHVRRCNLR